jgi:integrase
MGWNGGTRLPRIVHRLTAIAVTNAKAAGLYPDGGGLYLKVTSTGSKSWILRFRRDGRVRDMGLGSVGSISLARARERAAEANRQRQVEGLDPIKAREQERIAVKRAAARAATFRTCAEQMLASHEIGWRNAKHRHQSRSSMSTYVFPIFGDVAVSAIDTELVLKVLEPIWARKTETASRVRGRIEAVLDWAKVRGMRDGENSARWRGHLDQLLPCRSKVQAVQHYAALPYNEIAPLIEKLRAKHYSLATVALELIILTAVRSGEALGARWDEIDLGTRTWVIPAERTKGGREHRVPLSPRVVEILKQLQQARISEHVFPGMKPGRPLTSRHMLTVLNSVRPGVTIHGFRSSFKDWVSEMTNFPDHLSEAALAHVTADKVRAAYARSDLFEKRRRLMEQWAAYCGRLSASADVVPLQRQRAQ